MRYTKEKVLYFASRDTGLHVDIDEKSGTTLSELVYEFMNKGLLERVAEDDSGAYYKTTRKGEIKLLELQIAWRKANGKSTDEHERKLKEMVAA